MSNAHRFFWLAQQAFGGLLYFWQITLVLVILAGIASSYNFPFTPSRFCKKHLLVFSPFLSSVLILLVGVFMAHRGSPQNAPKLPGTLLSIFFLLQFPVGAAVIYRLKDYRWFAASIFLLALWVCMMCSFMAGMSVSNDWI